MSDNETVRELCTICEMQNSIIRAQSDALTQVGAIIMEEEKAAAAERYAALLGEGASSEEEGV